jgi:hypothetical protein
VSCARRNHGLAPLITRRATSRGLASIAGCCSFASSSIATCATHLTHDWYLHRSEERYLGFVFDRAKEVSNPLCGDVMVFRYGRCYSHGGIVTRSAPLAIVHAFQPAGFVLEEEVAQNPTLSAPGRYPKFFSLWATANEDEA